MKYEIESKHDLTGAMLVIRFPLEDLDKKALYTIGNDCPPFLIPFTYRSVDGMAECTYRLGNHSKLQYRFGAHSVPEYVKFWENALRPLLDCEDWFLKPLSFVLDCQWIYADKTGEVRYLYVPSLADCESLSSLKEMAMELSRQNSVADPALENQVLRAMMQGFQPESFLAMLHTSAGKAGAAAPAKPAAAARPEPVSPVVPKNEPPRPQMPPIPAPTPSPAMRQPEKAAPIPAAPRVDDGEIHIDLSGGKRSKQPKEKPVKEHKPLFGGKKDKPVKEHKPLFSSKKEKPREILLGAAENPPAAAYAVPKAPAAPVVSAVPMYSGMKLEVSYEAEAADGATQLDDGAGSGSCCLRLVGNAGLPREIAVDIQPGRAFTIGRFDVTVGQKQSDFEFAKETRAVSRRHAAIERREDGYYLVDLASSAGTFVNGQRLTPNVPQALTGGNRVSFGTGGADYIWTE